MIDLVYFIQNVETGNIKIGKSNNESLYNRFISLSSGNENDLKIIGVILTKKIGLESKLHKIFKEYRIKGEWFKSNDKLLKYIQTKSMSLEKFKEKDIEFRLCEDKKLIKKIKFKEISDKLDMFFNNYYEINKDNLKFFYNGFLKVSLQIIYEKMNKYYNYSVEDIKEVLKLNSKCYKFKKIKHHDEFSSEFKVSNFIIAMKYEQYS